jgi:hypothetical protein
MTRPLLGCSTPRAAAARGPVDLALAVSDLGQAGQSRVAPHQVTAAAEAGEPGDQEGYRETTAWKALWRA